jgi:glycosyltransferase involved in cell wall biosynthesis
LKNTSIPNVLLIPSLPRNAFDELVQVCDIGLVFLDNRFTIANFPSRILNYMEFKLPILFATDKNTDVGRIAVENSFGLWSESGDLQGFSRNLLELCGNQEMRFDMGEKGYEYLKQNYLTENSYEVIMKAVNQK